LWTVFFTTNNSTRQKTTTTTGYHLGSEVQGSSHYVYLVAPASRPHSISRTRSRTFIMAGRRQEQMMWSKRGGGGVEEAVVAGNAQTGSPTTPTPVAPPKPMPIRITVSDATDKVCPAAAAGF
jgi:hypothetical protein